ncbi:MAG: hypothetical protein WC002_10410 [Candidatus Muiribacteriota bacterium]
MDKTKIKEYSRIAVFAALWAASEVFLGNYLHSIRLPLKGMVLTSVPIFIFCIAVFYYKNPFSVIKTGIIVTVIRTVYSWHFNLNITLALFIQTILAFLCIFLLRKSKLTPLFIGILLQGWTFFQGYFYRVIFMGQDIVEVYEKAKTIPFFDIIISNILLVFTILYLIYTIPGIIAAYTGYFIGKELSEHEK